MKRTTKDIVADIAAFQPADGNWRGLDTLLNELWTAGAPDKAIADLLAVYERFPEEDGAGVFWSILHGLESLPGYEPHLARSVRRVPSDMGVTMLGRLLNGGRRDIEGSPIAGLLREAAERSDVGPEARTTAIGFLERHGGWYYH
jgi:hypothetical protein